MRARNMCVISAKLVRVPKNIQLRCVYASAYVCDLSNPLRDCVYAVVWDWSRGKGKIAISQRFANFKTASTACLALYLICSLLLPVAKRLIQHPRSKALFVRQNLVTTIESRRGKVQNRVLKDFITL